MRLKRWAKGSLWEVMYALEHSHPLRSVWYDLLCADTECLAVLPSLAEVRAVTTLIVSLWCREYVGYESQRVCSPCSPMKHCISSAVRASCILSRATSDATLHNKTNSSMLQSFLIVECKGNKKSHRFVPMAWFCPNLLFSTRISVVPRYRWAAERWVRI